MKTKGDQIREEIRAVGEPEEISLGYLKPLIPDWRMQTHSDLARWSRAQRELAGAAVVMIPWAIEVRKSLQYILANFENEELHEICRNLLNNGGVNS